MTEKLIVEALLRSIEIGIKQSYQDIDDYDRGYTDALKAEREQLISLQADYVPRIEMTPEQYGLVSSADKYLSALENIKRSVKAELTWLYTQEYGWERFPAISEEELHYLWLHPESIINSETGKPFVKA